jgi:hypothetical protein
MCVRVRSIAPCQKGKCVRRCCVFICTGAARRLPLGRTETELACVGRAGCVFGPCGVHNRNSKTHDDVPQITTTRRPQCRQPEKCGRQPARRRNQKKKTGASSPPMATSHMAGRLRSSRVASSSSVVFSEPAYVGDAHSKQSGAESIERLFIIIGFIGLTSPSAFAFAFALLWSCCRSVDGHHYLSFFYIQSHTHSHTAAHLPPLPLFF